MVLTLSEDRGKAAPTSAERVRAVVADTDWQAIVDKAVIQAKHGNHQARPG